MSDEPLRHIKRYANRKLYDLEESRYITLEEIATLIKDGVNIKVTDNNTNADLTALTLAQIIYEEEKKMKRAVPLTALRQVIQTGGEFLQRTVTEPIHSLKEEAERTVTRLIRREKDGVEEVMAAIREWVDTTQVAIEDVQRRLDDRVRLLVTALPHLRRTEEELAELRARLDAIEAHLGLPPKRPSTPDTDTTH
ncbi:MAG: hypothetical protein AMXMBFR64_10710 [Myxococcales bacterium]